MTVVLTGNKKTNIIIEKALSRLHCLKKLKSFDVRPDLLQMFFCSVVVSFWDMAVFAGEET